MKKVAVVVAVLTASIACNKQPDPIPEQPAATTTANAMTAMPAPGMPPARAAAAGPEDLAWTAPATWVSAPNPSPMRKATYKIPKVAPDTEDAELAVSSAGGGVEPNIKRWEGQFGDAKAKTEQRSVNGLKITTVEIKGKVAGGGMMGMPGTAAKDNQMLLGAVVDAGDRQHFFKMVGGEKTVTAAKPDFEKFVSSLHAK